MTDTTSETAALDAGVVERVARLIGPALDWETTLPKEKRNHPQEQLWMHRHSCRVRAAAVLAALPTAPVATPASVYDVERAVYAVHCARFEKPGMEQTPWAMDAGDREYATRLVGAALLALARCPSVAWYKAALAGSEGVESGPNGRGGMRVVVHFPNPGDEGALFGLLSDASCAARNALNGEAA